MSKLKIRFNDLDEYISIKGYIKYDHIVTLHYDSLKENLSGFKIYNDKEDLIYDCSDFIYRYDVLENENNEISYSDNPNIVQTEKYVRCTLIESVEPLNNEELTECVADLMYAVSMSQLGL